MNMKSANGIMNDNVSVDIKTSLAGCENRRESGSNISLVCAEENNQLTISFVIQFPVQNPVRVQVQCFVLTGNPFEKLFSSNISVED